MAKMSALKLNEQPPNCTPCPYTETIEQDETETRKVEMFDIIIFRACLLKCVYYRKR